MSERYDCVSPGMQQTLPALLLTVYTLFLFPVPVPETKRANCVTGDVRLADSVTDLILNTTKGTLQICINNAWGAVCHDDLFGVTDARVACQQAGGYEREIVDGVIESTAISGPVFLSELGCDENDTNLLDCRRYTYIGSECITAENAVMTCRGMRDIVHCNILYIFFETRF